MQQFQFEQKLRKILSNAYTLNQNQALRTQVQSVSKQQYKKRLKQKRQKRLLQDRKYFLQSSYKSKMRKYNANLMLMKKLLDQNNNIVNQMMQYPKIKEKVNIVGLIKNKLFDLKKILLFQQDIDEQNLQKTIKDNR